MDTSQRVMITGGGGFLGRYITNWFEAKGHEVIVPRSKEFDLRSPEETKRAFTNYRPDIVIHAAADVGGIGYNVMFPADIFANNLRIACNVMDAAKESNVSKLVNIGSACAYPGDAMGDMSEDAFLDGRMHNSVEVYGFSKRALYLGAEAYRQQYGLNSIFLILTNLYGPWDKYDPKDSHVVAAMIRRFADAVKTHAKSVTCWGTGAPVREFMYADDCADAIGRATEVYESVEPLNIGTGIGTSIRELALLTAEAAGFTGTVDWDSTKPDGAARKVLDINRMSEALGDEVKSTPFSQGLAETLVWYREHLMA